MKFRFQRVKSLSFGILLFAFPLCVLQSLAFLTSYDKNGANYFAHGAFLPSLVTVLTLLAAVACGLLFFFAKAEELEGKEPTCKKAFFLPGLGFAVCAILICFSDMESLKILGKALPAWLFPMLFLLSAIAFFLAAVPASEKNRDYTAGFMMIPILALLLMDAEFYFDLTMEMNAPIKVSVMLSLLASALYLLSEIRFLLGAPNLKGFLFTSLLTVLLSSLSALPLFLAYGLKLFTRADLLCGAVLSLSFLSLSVLRLLSFFKGKSTTEEEKSPSEDENEQC